MKNIKKVNCALLPPCSKVVKKHIQRTKYVSLLWNNATKSSPTEGRAPVDFGWELSAEGLLVPSWYDGWQFPNQITLEDNEEEEDSSNEWGESDDSDEGNLFLKFKCLFVG